MKDTQILPAHESGRAPRRILLVEDDLAIRQLIAQVLSGAGYRVDEAEDGAAAWVALGVRTYDLLITDNQMPRLTGVELLGKLDAAGKAVPVIMATGIAPVHVFARNHRLQPDAILLKPYTFEEMLETVKKVLRATDSPPEHIEPPSDWQGYPAADRFEI